MHRVAVLYKQVVLHSGTRESPLQHAVSAFPIQVGNMQLGRLLLSLVRAQRAQVPVFADQRHSSVKRTRLFENAPC